MIRIVLVMLLINFSSCSTSEDQVIKDQIQIYENNKNLFSDLSIDILRKKKNPSTIEYKVRKKDESGYAIFQTYPDLVIFRNLKIDLVNSEFIRKIDKFNSGKSIRLLKMQEIDNTVLLEFKINNNKILLSNGEKFNSTLLKNRDSILYLDNDWRYIRHPFVGGN